MPEWQIESDFQELEESSHNCSLVEHSYDAKEAVLRVGEGAIISVTW
jgi:hypothetical protein